MLEAMLHIPMDEAISSLGLRTQIQAALLGETTRERSLLSWMEASERGDWATCDAIEELYEISQHQFGPLAAEAVNWADKTIFSAA